MKERFIDYWKHARELFLKLIVTQLGITFFGLVVTMPMAARYAADLSKNGSASSQSVFLLALASIFSTIFYLFLQYYHCKDFAAKDQIRIRAGRQTFDRFFGLKTAFLANAFNLLLAVLSIFGRLFVTNARFFATAAELDQIEQFLPAWAGNLTEITRTVAQFAESMYYGIILLTRPYDPLMLLWIVLPSLLVCFLTYALIAGAPEKEKPKAE